MHNFSKSVDDFEIAQNSTSSHNKSGFAYDRPDIHIVINHFDKDHPTVNLEIKYWTHYENHGLILDHFTVNH